MKKILAILMSAVLLLGLLAGCGNESQDPAFNGDEVATPVAAGMLVLNAGASVNISYDEDGLVLNVEGADDNGSIVAGECIDYLGKPVAEAVCDLIGLSGASNFLSAETNFVLIKQAFGSALPSATFLETICSEAEYAVKEFSPAKIIVLTTENLDADGYINLESAKQLLLAYLALESFDTLEGTAEPIDGLYSFAVTAGEMSARFIIDGITGEIFEGELEGVHYGDEMTDEVQDITEATDVTLYEEDPSTPTDAQTPDEPTISEDPPIVDEAE